MIKEYLVIEAPQAKAGAGIVQVVDNGNGTIKFQLSNGSFTSDIPLPDGADGADGADGVGVTGVIDNGNGSFKFVLSDETVTDDVLLIVPPIPEWPLEFVNAPAPFYSQIMMDASTQAQILNSGNTVSGFYGDVFRTNAEFTLTNMLQGVTVWGDMTSIAFEAGAVAHGFFTTDNLSNNIYVIGVMIYPTGIDTYRLEVGHIFTPDTTIFNDVTITTTDKITIAASNEGGFGHRTVVKINGVTAGEHIGTEAIPDPFILFGTLISCEAPAVSITVDRNYVVSGVTNFEPLPSSALTIPNDFGTGAYFVSNAPVEGVFVNAQTGLVFNNQWVFFTNNVPIGIVLDKNLLPEGFTQAEADLRYNPLIKNKRDGSSPPSVNNDSSEGYSFGSIWVDNSPYPALPIEAYKLVDPAIGAAVWLKTTLTLDELGSMALGVAGTGTNEFRTNGQNDELYAANVAWTKILSPESVDLTGIVSGKRITHYYDNNPPTKSTYVINYTGIASEHEFYARKAPIVITLNDASYGYSKTIKLGTGDYAKIFTVLPDNDTTGRFNIIVTRENSERVAAAFNGNNPIGANEHLTLVTGASYPASALILPSSVDLAIGTVCRFSSQGKYIPNAQIPSGDLGGIYYSGGFSNSVSIDGVKEALFTLIGTNTWLLTIVELFSGQKVKSVSGDITLIPNDADYLIVQEAFTTWHLYFSGTFPIGTKIQICNSNGASNVIHYNGVDYIGSGIGSIPAYAIATIQWIATNKISFTISNNLA